MRKTDPSHLAVTFRAVHARWLQVASGLAPRVPESREIRAAGMGASEVNMALLR